MVGNEIIVVKDIPKKEFQELAARAVRYALISVAFTYNRMDKTDLISRINNIVKGKIAESIFFYYCKHQYIQINSQICTTPFWLPDLRDFLWLGGEWDIKNNYFYCCDDKFDEFPIELLPALIPHKNEHDQWSKRNDMLVYNSRFNAYLFTFMRLKPKDKTFFNIKIADEQLDFLHFVYQKYSMAPYGEMPFLESWFYEQIGQKGAVNQIDIAYQPEMVITGCANARYWSLFQPTSAFLPSYHYQYFKNERPWYQKSGDILRFLDGALVTKINNMTCPVALLPSFLSVLNK